MSRAVVLFSALLHRTLVLPVFYAAAKRNCTENEILKVAKVMFEPINNNACLCFGETLLLWSFLPGGKQNAEVCDATKANSIATAGYPKKVLNKIGNNDLQDISLQRRHYHYQKTFVNKF